VNVHLTSELEQFVQAKIESGLYNSTSEVVGEALRLMERTEELRVVQLRDLRARMDQGLAEADRGEGADGEAFMQGLLDDLDCRHA